MPWIKILIDVKSKASKKLVTKKSQISSLTPASSALPLIFLQNWINFYGMLTESSSTTGTNWLAITKKLYSCGAGDLSHNFMKPSYYTHVYKNAFSGNFYSKQSFPSTFPWKTKWHLIFSLLLYVWYK